MLSTKPISASPILITGGAQRVGFYCAKTLAELGYEVIVTYRKERPQLKTLRSLGVHTLHADFKDEQSVERFCQSVKQQFSSLFAIIHNASEWLSETPNQSIAEQAALFNRMMFIHGQVPYLLNLQLKERLQRGGNIIHISDYVVERGSAKHIAYAASKAALEGMTRSFAAQFAPDIRVNCIAPSLIVFNEQDDDEYRSKTLQKSVLGIEPGEQELFHAVHYLLTSHYVTGRTLHVDGGRHLKAGT